jgi:CRISPR-associated endoribonuclease Cas6
MRLKIVLRSKSPIELPLSYNQVVQGFIYHNMTDQCLQQFIHNEGFIQNKRTFKFFSFSRLKGFYKIQKASKRISFLGDVTFQVTSMFEPFIQDLGTTIMKKEQLMLGNNQVEVVSLSMDEHEVKETMKIKTVSPIVIYSTFQNEHKKFTYYYHPGEPQFSSLIRKNLIRKASILYNEIDEWDFMIKPVQFDPSSPNVVHYKNFIIRGWSGIFELKGHKDLMNIAYHYGLGSKNSQGFGMIEEV